MFVNIVETRTLKHIPLSTWTTQKLLQPLIDIMK